MKKKNNILKPFLTHSCADVLTDEWNCQCVDVDDDDVDVEEQGKEPAENDSSILHFPT